MHSVKIQKEHFFQDLNNTYFFYDVMSINKRLGDETHVILSTVIAQHYRRRNILQIILSLRLRNPHNNKEPQE
ncbi:hypothetical protein M5689_003258 [Euphorbia peplus]|nr:hypothetical protein M5689_003258 [Euphorbia peplus]